jgi:membrane associated rhomboid family serine protease
MSYGHRADQLIFTFGFIPERFFAEQAEGWLNISGFLPVFSSMFLHANLIHLISNMWMLWIFGDNVEDCMGHGRYLLFFLLCGVASVAAQALANPQSALPMIGASGAISGVLGAYFLTYPHARILTLLPIFILIYLIELPAYFFLGFWFVLLQVFRCKDWQRPVIQSEKKIRRISRQ